MRCNSKVMDRVISPITGLSLRNAYCGASDERGNSAPDIPLIFCFRRSLDSQMCRSLLYLLVTAVAAAVVCTLVHQSLR